jgi:hypothetical protein
MFTAEYATRILTILVGHCTSISKEMPPANSPAALVPFIKAFASWDVRDVFNQKSSTRTTKRLGRDKANCP